MTLTEHPLVLHAEDRLRSWFGSVFRDRRWLLAVSGGLDSMSLWRVMQELLPPGQLAIAHFDHGTRGNRSRTDVEFVRDRASQLGMAFFCERTEGEGRSEEWLRDRRRAFLLQVRKEWKAEAVLTAHHGSDQFETFLMRILRGSGLDGLGAIRPCQAGFARPLLGISRPELERFAATAGVEFREDRSNDTDRYLRNRVRRSLVPAFRVLAGEFGGEEAFLGRLNETLHELQGAAHWMAGETDALFEQRVVATPLWFRLASSDLMGMSSIWTSRLIGRIATEMGLVVPTRAQRDGVLRAVEGGHGKFEFVGGVRGEVSCGQVFFFKPQSMSRFSLSFQTAGNQLRSSSLGWRARTESGWLEGKCVRAFRPGDRYVGKKLKEWWLERRVPAPERSLIPLVAQGDGAEILWVFPETAPGLVCESMGFPFSFLSPRRNSPVVSAH